MASYKRVVLKETETDAKNGYATNDVQQQLNKFDTSYTSKKLNDLYNEFDSITFNNDVASSTIVKENAVEKVNAQTSLKTVVYLSTAIIVTLLLAFLAIYNIFVINGLNSNIKLLQNDVSVAQVEFDNISNSFNKLTEEELKQLIKDSLDGNYGDIASNGFVNVGMLETTNPNEYSVSSNWFDKLCTFISNIFGG